MRVFEFDLVNKFDADSPRHTICSCFLV